MNTLCFDGSSPQLWNPHSPNSAVRLKSSNTMNAASLLLSQQQQHQPNLTFTTQDAAQRAILQVLARDKRRREGDDERLMADSNKEDFSEPSPAKKQRKQEPPKAAKDPAPVLASDEGIATFNDNDVLSGRGGGTNVHPGNRHFRDLINRSRRAYLKARKNDKPAISREIVKSVRKRGGRFLKREEGSNLWFEIGDDAAREKTSQALRQRAPEMRKVLFESEMQQARQQVEQLQKSQRRFLTSSLPLGFSQSRLPPSPTNMLNPFVGLPNKSPFSRMASNIPNSEAYAQLSQDLITATLLSGGINRISPHGA